MMMQEGIMQMNADINQQISESQTWITSLPGLNSSSSVAKKIVY